MDRIIFRSPIRTEYRVSFPFLYNSLPRSVKLAWYSHPQVVYVPSEDPSLPAFYFDPIINPISSRAVAPKNISVSHEDMVFGDSDEDDEDDFQMPEDVEPFMADEEARPRWSASQGPSVVPEALEVIRLERAAQEGPPSAKQAEPDANAEGD